MFSTSYIVFYDVLLSQNEYDRLGGHTVVKKRGNYAAHATHGY